jgi:hypothetical protein
MQAVLTAILPAESSVWRLRQGQFINWDDHLLSIAIEVISVSRQHDPVWPAAMASQLALAEEYSHRDSRAKGELPQFTNPRHSKND